MMSGNFLARVTVIAFALLLGACGGGDGGGSLGGPDDGGGSGGGDGEPTVDVGSVQISASPIVLGTSPGAVSDIQVFVKDDSNRVLEGVPVDFRVDSDATLEVVRGVTDQSGTAVATLTTITNPANRRVTVTVTAGDRSSSLPIDISGTTLEIDGPTTLPINSEANYTARLLDSNGDGIVGQSVEISNDAPQNVLSMPTNVTNDSGELRFTLSARTPGSDTVTLSAFSNESTLLASQQVDVSNDDFQFISPGANTEIPMNTTGTVSVQWIANGSPVAGQPVNFFTTRGSLAVPSGETTTDAQGVASMDIASATAGPALVEARSGDSIYDAKLDLLFFSNEPSKVNVKADRTQLDSGEQTVIRAVLRDDNNNLVKNREILFNIEQDVSGGSLLGAVATTDRLGRASVVYVAGSGSGTARNGVIISAAERESIGSPTPIRGQTALTVSDGALRITLGTGNEIREPDTDHYTTDWVVYVTDVNGEPVENAIVELSALPFRYDKGIWEQAFCGTDECWVRNPSVTCPAEDINLNGILEGSEDLNCNQVLDPGEDVNNDGILQVGEDINGNCKLDPSNDGVVVTEDLESSREGAVHFEMTYPQSNCGWTEMRIEARANVDGTEYSESVNARLSCAASDLDDWEIPPPAISGGSKYGQAADCQNPN